MTGEELTREQSDVLSQMVANGKWYVRAGYDAPDPICDSLVRLGLATGRRLSRSEYVPLSPFPDHYVATPAGEHLIKALAKLGKGG